ncbi:uncharacterized protein LOC118280461 isoform X2 [Spodoptera frugiperda]|uniref:Uncharacterized protein LOC118280461 isoform X2 n=1 Tax=Spodoptera frugiperda TaxID=7108 RepID=A0A9R0F174_SPOFR|nr:uncharacterized protein LOC118280461 isoform X2 [Spodoptera frugiperda]
MRKKMFIKIFLIIILVSVCLCFWFISFENDGIIKINITKETGKCIIPQLSYKFKEGMNLSIVLPTDPFINYGWLHVNKSNNESFTIDGTLKSNQTTPYTTVVNRYMAGAWEFEFYLYRDNQDILPNIRKVPYTQNQNRAYYTPIKCHTHVTVDWSDTVLDTKFIIICSILGTLALLIIIVQAIYIFYLKSLARRLNAHNNLSKKADSSQSDRARYCSNPRQKKIKEVAPVDRDSVIYEAPNIEINDIGRKHLFPPNPPAISTMPRTPQMDRSMGMHQPMHGATLNRSPGMDHTHSFPRQPDRDMASRPPLPLPPQDNYEVYEQMNDDMDTYEPPPVASHTMPPRLPMPPKKVPTANLVNVKEDTLKARRGARPPITPKPQMPHPAAPVNELEQVLKRRQAGIESATVSRNNELEEAFRKRNNVKQVPIVSIPDPSAAKPRFTAKSKPQMPQPQPMQEEIYYNENQASSDEEWTYEPLKPHKNYDSNIYNI